MHVGSLQSPLEIVFQEQSYFSLHSGMRAQLLKIKMQMLSIWAKAFMLMCVYLTLHDYPSLVEGESHGILLYYNCVIFVSSPIHA